jgi:hypothetical protein
MTERATPLSTVELSDAEADEVEAWVRAFLAAAPPDEFACADLLYAQADRLPSRLREVFADLNSQGLPDGVLLRGLPIERFELPPTPNTDESLASPAPWAADPAVAMLGLLAVQLGEIIGYAGTQYGKIFTDLIPQRSDADLVNSAFGYKHAFGLHTDVSFHQLPPTWFGLLCIRNVDHVPTTLAFLRDVELDADTEEILRTQPLQAPQSFAERVGVDAA